MPVTCTHTLALSCAKPEPQAPLVLFASTIGTTCSICVASCRSHVRTCVYAHDAESEAVPVAPRAVTGYPQDPALCRSEEMRSRVLRARDPAERSLGPRPGRRSIHICTYVRQTSLKAYTRAFEHTRGPCNSRSFAQSWCTEQIISSVHTYITWACVLLANGPYYHLHMRVPCARARACAYVLCMSVPAPGLVAYACACAWAAIRLQWAELS